MFRKINLKSVLASFIILLAIAAIVEIVDLKKGDRTFRSDIIEINPDEITEIQLFPKVLNGELIRFYKDNGKWAMESKGKKYNVNESLPGSMISELNEIKPESVAATKKDQWKQFEVTDSLGTRVKLLNNSKVLCDLLVGKFTFDQSRKSTSFVRLAGEKEVYGINGFLALAFNRDLNTYRDQTIIKKGNSDWTKLTFTYPSDSSFTINKVNNKWFVDGVQADSAKVAEYFSGISNLVNNSFIEQVPSGEPAYSLLIEGDNLIAPIKIDGYQQGDGTMVLSSNQNPGTYFKSKDLEDKIFISRKKLINQY
jgi:hypothetical protein